MRHVAGHWSRDNSELCQFMVDPASSNQSSRVVPNSLTAGRYGRCGGIEHLRNDGEMHSVLAMGDS